MLSISVTIHKNDKKTNKWSSNKFNFIAWNNKRRASRRAPDRSNPIGLMKMKMRRERNHDAKDTWTVRPPNLMPIIWFRVVFYISSKPSHSTLIARCTGRIHFHSLFAIQYHFACEIRWECQWNKLRSDSWYYQAGYSVMKMDGSTLFSKHAPNRQTDISVREKACYDVGHA